MSTLSIVIPVFNKFHLTQRCLRSILDNSTGKHQITVIDNASTDETSQELPKLKAIFTEKGWNFEVITNPKNVGFGRAMNQGAKVSTGEFLALVNNDTFLLPEWDKNLLTTLEAHPELDLIFPYIDETKPFDEAETLKRGLLFQRRNQRRMRKTFTGVLMFFRKKAFDELQGFDERFFVTYEDTDLRVRMDQKNMQYRMVGSCFIWHQSMATRGDKKSLPPAYELEGKKLFFDKWGFHYADKERTQRAKWSRRWVRFLNRWGFL